MAQTEGASDRPSENDPNVGDVLELRERSRKALLEKNFDARRLTYSSTYVAHTPDYTIVDTQGLLDALSSGRVSYDSSDNVIEYARAHTPDMVVIMGIETVVPSAGRPNAGLSVPRRFTDIYRKEGGEWRHDLRHAHIATADLARGVVPPSSPARHVSNDVRVREVLDYRQRTFDALKAGTQTDPTGRYASTFIANTPMGIVVTGDEMRANFSGGRVGYASVDQQVEYAAAHTPEMVVIMGGEIVVPREGTQNAGKMIHRRFSDVFRLEDGEWRHDLRHANVWKID